MATVTPVLWWTAHAGIRGSEQWDGGLGTLGRTVRQAIPGAREMEGDFIDTEPTLVLVPGQHHASLADYDRLSWALARQDRALLVIFGDEESSFDWTQIAHPDVRFWVMTPRRSVHGDMPASTRFIGEGSGPTVAMPSIDRDLDLYFGGQITHDRRQELADVLRPLQSETVVLEETAGFMQGRPVPGYRRMLARAKIAPCPAGATSVDSFRFYESVEAGCVPVVELRDPRGVEEDTWQMMAPDWFPFPVVRSWDELPGLLPDLIANHEEYAAKAQLWWAREQARMVDDLRTDLAWLGATVRP